jgi:hypothetical protein
MAIAVLYRWSVKPGMEAQFRDGWLRGTRAIHARCGSSGARLHRAADGIFVSYAVWPDEATRKRCFADNDFSAEGFDGMRAAVAAYHGEEILDVLDDALEAKAAQ